MFADDLREQLKANHMTQKDLGEYLGVKQCSVSNWLNGRTKPNDRAFDMIVELFELKREHYTEERAGIKKEEKKPEVVGAFQPKPYVDPKVKEKVDLSENPYKKAKKEEPFRCDMEIKKLKKSHGDFLVATEKSFAKVSKFLNEQTDANNHFSDKFNEINSRIAVIEEKITYLRGLIDGAYTDKPELESKSWWKRLWS